ncbi:flagellar export protein FliJ [Paenalkalicoccus suaedae]|uniref:Flagellar FliJ protein n=1 Tax=Paenalkalicoccus suaedae TaxID=2592382 RepID=A0A859FEB6_9BACI|nr:flagellar export protein FliJ [Paenalkalicoccus suaedae]QKS71437.1 flagellar export protein FliJ [Paenalkalicoccus suaedae]
MSFTYQLQKVLEIKEYEKAAAEKEFSDSVRSFEESAKELYAMLKRREELIDQTQQQIMQGMSIAFIQQNEQTISFLEQEIGKLQKITQKARREMQEKESFLTVKSVDLKKYERMKEIEFERYVEHEKQEEMKFLDEVSVNQFIRR